MAGEEKKLPKAKVRPAVASDFDQIYPLLQELNNTRFTREIWQRLFTNLWGQDNWSPGYVLDTGARVVGFLGGLYSEIQNGEEKKVICNLTSWIVEDDYRSSSLMLLMPFLKQKGVVLTSLTSSPEAYKVYKKLGFKDLDSSAKIIYPLPSLSRSYRLLTTEKDILPRLNGSDLQCYKDHQGLDVKQFAICKGDRTCYLLITRRLGKGHIQQVGDLTLFREAIGSVRGKLCKALEVKSLQIDERMLGASSMLLTRTKGFAQAKQYRGDINPELISGAYSELSILATP